MDQYDVPNYGAYQAMSDDRPPQFNGSTCGYRCGWGCCEPRGGDDDSGGSEVNDTPTLVNSDSEDEETDEVSPPENIDEAHPMEVPLPEAPLDGVEYHLRLDLHVIIREDLLALLQQHWNYEESLNSMDPEASSGSRSSAAPDGRSIGTISPIDWDAGICGWMDENQVDLQPQEWIEELAVGPSRPKNYFCATPLRLSPQNEHCRGSLLSHLVVYDAPTPDFAEEHSRRHMPGDGYSFWQDPGRPAR